MPADALLTFNAVSGVADTITASGTSYSASAPLLPGVQKSHALIARIYVRSASCSGAGTCQFKVQGYSTNTQADAGTGAGWYDLAVKTESAFALTSTAVETIVTIPFSGGASTGGGSVVAGSFVPGTGLPGSVRLAIVLTPTTGTPTFSVTYLGDICIAEP